MIKLARRLLALPKILWDHGGMGTARKPPGKGGVYAADGAPARAGKSSAAYRRRVNLIKLWAKRLAIDSAIRIEVDAGELESSDAFAECDTSHLPWLDATIKFGESGLDKDRRSLAEDDCVHELMHIHLHELMSYATTLAKSLHTEAQQEAALEYLDRLEDRFICRLTPALVAMKDRLLEEIEKERPDS